MELIFKKILKIFRDIFTDIPNTLAKGWRNEPDEKDEILHFEAIATYDIYRGKINTTHGTDLTIL